MKYIVCLLALAAIVWAVYPVARLFLNPKDGREGLLVVLPLKGHVEDVELRVRGAVRLAGRVHATVLLADFRADGETREICTRLCREFDSVELIDGNAIAERAGKDR